MEIETWSEERFLTVILIEVKPGFFSRLKRSLSRRPNGEYQKEELAELLADKADRSERTAYSFLRKLDDHDVLVKTGKEPTASGPKPVFKIDRSRLLAEIPDTEWYQNRVDLWRYLLDTLGDY